MNAKIEKGRALVLVGPQGCGKTTLARYEGKELDVRQLGEARQAIAAAGYRFDAGQRAWVKAQRRSNRRRARRCE